MTVPGLLANRVAVVTGGTGALGQAVTLRFLAEGGVVAVPEETIGPALKRLGRLGLYVEPTAATAGAALGRLLADRTISPGETTVAVFTGHASRPGERTFVSRHFPYSPAQSG